MRMNIIESGYGAKVGNVVVKNPQNIQEGVIGQAERGEINMPLFWVPSAPTGVTKAGREAVKALKRGDRITFSDRIEWTRDIFKINVEGLGLSWKEFEPFLDRYEESLSDRMGHVGIPEKIIGRILAEIIPNAVYLEPEDLLPVNKKGEFITLRETGQRLKDIIENGGVPIIPGFVVLGHDGRSTTLPPGGSDRTLVALMLATDTDGIIFKEDYGIFSADPNLVPNARKKDILSSDEIIEMTIGEKMRAVEEGAAQLLKKGGRNLEVRHYRETNTNGTIIIRERTADPDEIVSVVTGKENYAITKLSHPEVRRVAGWANKITSALRDREIPLEDIFTSINAVAVSTEDDPESEENNRVDDEVRDELRRVTDSDEIPDFGPNAQIAVIGEGLKQNRKSNKAAGIIGEALDEADIELRGMTYAPDSIKIGVYVPAGGFKNALTTIHDHFFPPTETTK